MKRQNIGASIFAVMLLCGSVFIPLAANAQSRHNRAVKHRQETKNNWRNVAIGAGVVSAYGFLKHDNVLGFAGLAGTLYSVNRYEHDRKSQNHLEHSRANWYNKTVVYHNGHRYKRKMVTRHGNRYYQFVRG